VVRHEFATDIAHVVDCRDLYLHEGDTFSHKYNNRAYIDEYIYRVTSIVSNNIDPDKQIVMARRLIIAFGALRETGSEHMFRAVDVLKVRASAERETFETFACRKCAHRREHCDFEDGMDDELWNQQSPACRLCKHMTGVRDVCRGKSREANIVR
jgi:hypothetical protein